ncbi:hypothetical protein [Aureibacillus halotolerans]|uniref:Lipoprotein n=1 Tax=Aureibacillus halotolerans TaxID=1508390 RepID=A0A4R6TSE1_9BACI|nr:hypothetical protein [Aureibacillus halotolerans]TDQ33780.1 hypothetical protein EV213_12812 [Aureibacillus halotolerans]
MRKILIICLTTLVLMLVSCSHTVYTSKMDWLPSVKESDEILLYDRVDQRLITYNTKTYSIVEKNDTLNYFQFDFKTPDASIYTTGHSIENNYKIIQKNGNETTVLLSMEPLEAIFPLALKDENKAFFIKSYYDEEGSELYNQRAIVEMDLEKKQLKKLSNTEGLLTTFGVYHKDQLYFTTYIGEDDSYNLYRIDGSNLQNVPELVFEKLETPEVYVSGDQLWLSNKNSIYYDEKTLPKGNFNYFYRGKLIQINANSSEDLVLNIIDVNSEVKEETIERIVDFKVEGKTMTVYTHDGIQSIELN